MRVPTAERLGTRKPFPIERKEFTMRQAPNAGEAIASYSAENALTNGLPWPEASRSRTTAAAMRAMVHELRVSYGLSTSVSNRTFYAVDEAPDDRDSQTEDVGRTRLIAWTYDDAGFLSVVAADAEGRPAKSS
jgi:hypothetical protein